MNKPNPTPPQIDSDGKTAFDRFTESAKKIVRVTKDEIEREEQKWRTSRKKTLRKATT